MPQLWPLIYAKISFPLIISRTNWLIFTKFYICIHIDRSSLGLMHVIFQTFVPELWPLIYPKIPFPFNILRMKGQHFTKLYITINTDKIYPVIFCKFLRELWPLIDVRIRLPLNVLRSSGLLLHAKHCSRAIVRF